MAVGTESVTATVDEGDEILKPCTDKREYRRIVLKNSLEVLLISDPETDKHMLFYASEKYPEEHGFMKYVSEHGGSTNAYTSTEDTNYHFDVNSDCFDEALDRFAQFFIKPLMSADATMREIKAVDSENQKNLLSDSWRMRQLHKHLSREDHPYHKFSTGNLDTLHVRPEAKGIDIRSELTKFYDEYYSANIMHLVVYGKENLDKTQCLVEELFQEIRNTNKGIPRFPGQPCTSDHLQVLVEAVPIRQGHTLSVSWPVTPSIHHYEEAPCKYLSHLIGHEGEGSLFHAFKILGWATSLYAYEAGSTMEYSFFYVWIDLTDAGHEHMEDILGLLFRHSKLLQQSGVSQWIFNELSAICEAEFHYQAKIDPISYATSISTKMTMYPTKHWLVGSSLPSRFNPAILQKVLDELSPTNVRIFWESNKFEGETNKVEPWYNTAYSLEKITESTIQEWMQSAPDVNLLLPTPNVFIPTDFSLKDVKDKDIFPVLLRKTSFSRLWYKPDTKFFKPKAYIMMNFNYPLAFSSHNAGPGHIDSRVELLLKNFESKLYDMSDEEFKSNVTALIDMKLEKHKNLEEESLFYWREIQNGTLKFNRRDVEVVALRELKKEELIDFFDEYIKVDAPKKKSLSICVYGNQHLQEMASDKDNIPSPSIEIEDIVCFRKSQPLYGSLRGCSQLKL